MDGNGTSEQLFCSVDRPDFSAREGKKERIGFWYLLFAIVLLIFLADTARPQGAQNSSEQAYAPALVPVTIVVSVEPKHGTEFPVLYPEDVRVFQGDQRLKVTEWVPLQEGEAGMELMIVVDDACDTSSVGLQLDDLRAFINALPDSTAVGVGYIHNSTVQIRQQPTRDHFQAAKSLRLPFGRPAAYSSPYLAITDLIAGWQVAGSRRAIFLVSPGIDGLEPGASNPYLDRAIARAQAARIAVYTIYGSGGSQADRYSWRLGFGQGNLSELADRTGGESYFQGSRTPLSFAPFLKEFGDRLHHQFKLTFLAYAGEKDKTQRIRLETEVPNVELIGPEEVTIPGVSR